MLQGWHRFLFNFLIALLVGWWMLRLPIPDFNKYLLIAIIVGAVTVDFAITFFIRRNRSKKAFRFLHTDTMPKTTTYAELRKQVALSTPFYLFIAIAAASIPAVAVFESPVTPITVGATALAILVPQKYWSIRRHYRPIDAQGGADTRHQLEFVEGARGVYGSRLMPVAYVVSVTILAVSMAIWLIAS